MNKKVLFILSIPPPFGGGEIISQVLYNSIENDYECITFSKSNYSKSKQGNKNIFSYFFGIYYITVVFIKLIRIRPSAIYIGLPKTFHAFLRNAIIIWIAVLFKIQVCCEFHGMNFPFIENSKFQNKVLAATLQRISKIRVLSISIKKYIVDLGYSGSIYVINNGIHKPSEITTTNPQKNSKFNILYLGAISKSKGFLRVLEILNSLDDHLREKIHLNVIGEFVHTSEFDHFHKFIEEKRLSDYITFHGQKSGTDKWRLISNNHLLIHLSNFDGQPLTIIEAMSLGIPTIATKVGAIPEMINNNINGFLIKDNDEAKDIITNLLTKNINYELICENSYSTFQNHFTADKMVNNIINMIKE